MFDFLLIFLGTQCFATLTCTARVVCTSSEILEEFFCLDVFFSATKDQWLYWLTCFLLEAVHCPVVLYLVEAGEKNHNSSFQCTVLLLLRNLLTGDVRLLLLALSLSCYINSLVRIQHWVYSVFVCLHKMRQFEFSESIKRFSTLMYLYECSHVYSFENWVNATKAFNPT